MTVSKFLELVTKGDIGDSTSQAVVYLIPHFHTNYYSKMKKNWDKIRNCNNNIKITNVWSADKDPEEFSEYDIIDLGSTIWKFKREFNNQLRSEIYSIEQTRIHLILSDFELGELQSRKERVLEHIYNFRWEVAEEIYARWNGLINQDPSMTLFIEIFKEGSSDFLTEYYLPNESQEIVDFRNLAKIVHDSFKRKVGYHHTSINHKQLKDRLLSNLINRNMRELLADTITDLGSVPERLAYNKLAREQDFIYRSVKFSLSKEIWSEIYKIPWLKQNLKTLHEGSDPYFEIAIPLLEMKVGIEESTSLGSVINNIQKNCKITYEDKVNIQELISKGEINFSLFELIKKYNFENQFSGQMVDLYRNITENHLVTSMVETQLESKRKSLFIIIDGLSFFDVIGHKFMEKGNLEFGFSNLPTITKNFFSNCNLIPGTDGVKEISSYLGVDFEYIEKFASSNDLTYVIYDTTLDRVGRTKGSEINYQAERKLKQIDDLVNKIFQDKIKASFDIILCSDHGLIETKEFEDFDSKRFIKLDGGSHHRYIVSKTNEIVNLDNMFVLDPKDSLTGNREKKIWATPKKIAGVGHKNNNFRSWHGGLSLRECIVPLLIWR